MVSQKFSLRGKYSTIYNNLLTRNVELIKTINSFERGVSISKLFDINNAFIIGLIHLLRSQNFREN